MYFFKQILILFVLTTLSMGAREKKICNKCGGEKIIKCKRCNGAGSIGKNIESYKVCPKCKGVKYQNCNKCKGTGYK